MRIAFSREAIRDIASQRQWLEQRSASAAEALVEALDRNFALLMEHPLIAPAVSPIHRERFVDFGQFGLIVRYEVHADVVRIVRVFHGAQDRA